jgi:hypothetical protein
MVELRAPNRFVRYEGYVLTALWKLSRGNGLQNVLAARVGNELLDLPVAPDAAEAARRVLGDLVADARTSMDVFMTVAGFMQASSMDLLARLAEQPRSEGAPFPEAPDETTALMSILAEGSIKISRPVLDRFAALIEEQAVEERYQEFLQQNPVLLDPLAAEIIPKQRLGLEYATDFAVRSHDNRWLLVEIERPQDPLFTEKNDFRERFTHAFGQVLDFQHWVDDNVSYAQRHMRLITAPRGLVVMGLRSRLSHKQEAKLRRFSDNSRRIDIVTYDDLLARARSLYENLYYGAK